VEESLVNIINHWHFPQSKKLKPHLDPTLQKSKYNKVNNNLQNNYEIDIYRYLKLSKNSSIKKLRNFCRINNFHYE